MQVNFNNKEIQFKVPDYNVGDNVIAFSYISGSFFKGEIINIQTYTDKNQNSINYTIALDEQKAVPNVPEALVFNNTDEAKEWIDELQSKLEKV